MDIRNVAIIAHVDHGKTTLVDQMLRQSGAIAEHQRVAERAMDTGELERERGITILSKCTAVDWRGTRINIVDTPGHADFGGEVERILGMVDGVVLLVDAAEGPLPQTKFVTAKALALGLRPIVVINKLDRADARADAVLNEIFDLFVALEANEAQLDFPVLYASGRQGWASPDPARGAGGLAPLFALIIRHVDPPAVDPDGPFKMLASILEADPFLGRVLTGRVEAGAIAPNQIVKALDRQGREVERLRVTKLLAFRGLDRVPVDRAAAGDIIALAGLERASVADTICDPDVSVPLAARPVDPPTLAIAISINDSPLAGRDGDKLQSRVIRERLMREAEGNIAIRVTETGEADTFEVAGRGELQLGVLVETMRREGYELSVGRPRVLFRTDPATGRRLEPMEQVQIDVDEAFTGVVVEKLAARGAELRDLRPSGGGKVRLAFIAPARGLIGYQGELLSDTRGTGVMHRIFHGYGPDKGQTARRRVGVLVSNAEGKAVAYALWNLEDRGTLFIEPGAEVYSGMIIGEHARGNDLEVNPLKSKQLTNIRAAGRDDAVTLTAPRVMTLEAAMAYIDDDELVEVTPKAIRLRKRLLDQGARKKMLRRRAEA